MTHPQDDNIYHRILELPEEVTNPNAYELLGLARFESDPKTIKTAAMDRNALLQRMQNAENYEAVKTLEREVGEALVCLTNPKTKAEYDQSLSQAVELAEVVKAPDHSAEVTQPIPTANIATAGVKTPPTDGRKQSAQAERHEPKIAHKSLPGEIPWQLKDYWWTTHPELAKRIGIGAGVLLLLILIISL